MELGTRRGERARDRSAMELVHRGDLVQREAIDDHVAQEGTLAWRQRLDRGIERALDRRDHLGARRGLARIAATGGQLEHRLVGQRVGTLASLRASRDDPEPVLEPPEPRVLDDPRSVTGEQLDANQLP